MSVKIGVGFGGWPFPDSDPERLWEYVDACECLGIDSIWLSDRIVSEVLSLEPLIALSFIAARTRTLKFGTSVLALPLRNPTVLAKEIATLDYLSRGRVLPAVGIGTEDEVTFHGRYFTLNQVTVQPKPVQRQLPPIWIGGRSDAAIRRTARVGGGWLVSQATPDEVGVGIERIKSLTQETGNEIEDDHYGVLFSFCIADTPEEAARLAAPHMLRRRSDVPYQELSAFGPPEHVSRMIDQYISAGASKFVARPACPPSMMMDQLELLARETVGRYHVSESESVA